MREDGALVVSASGSDIWSYQDGMHFVYQEAAGDVTVTVRLHSAATTNAWSKSGIVVRASDNAGAANANGEPVYLRLIRQGQRVTGQYSVDGSTWTNLATVDVDLPEQVLVGIASTAHNTALVGDAVFTEWTME